MSFSISNRALVRGMLAGAVVLTGTSCSRSDRTESGRDNSAAVLPDTSRNAADAGTATGSVNDTATTPAQPSTPSQPSTSGQSNTPRAETAPPSDKDAAGYRSMERDTTYAPGQRSDSARVTADSAEVSSVPADTTVTETSAAADTAANMAGGADTASVGYAEMARDTSTVADQADTAATPNGDVALQASIDTSSQADSTEILGQVTTNSTAEGVSPDSVELVRVRPPEDSTELLGNADEAVDETADEQVIEPEDRETVAAAEVPTDEVGAAAIGGNLTGAEAVALMSREGVRCAVVDPEANEAVRWDMSSTPVTLNPCGMGSMNLSRIWTER
jgi:hypothetical protein